MARHSRFAPPHSLRLLLAAVTALGGGAVHALDFPIDALRDGLAMGSGAAAPLQQACPRALTASPVGSHQAQVMEMYTG